jgi:hypothetical protein
MTGRQVIWIAIVFIIIGMTWGDPQPASSSTRQLPLQSVGLNDVDDDNDDNDMPLGAAGYIKMASIQSCTVEHLTAARDAALVDLSHGSRAPPRAPAELIYRVVLLSLPTVFDRSEVCSASSLLAGSSLDTTESNTPCLAVRRIGPVLMAQLNHGGHVQRVRGRPATMVREFVPLHADQFGRRRSRRSQKES